MCEIELDTDDTEGVQQMLAVGDDQTREPLAEVAKAWRTSEATAKAARLADDLQRAREEASAVQAERRQLEGTVIEALSMGRPVDHLEEQAVALGIRADVVGRRVEALAKLAGEARRAALADLRSRLEAKAAGELAVARQLSAAEHRNLLDAIEEQLPQLMVSRRLAANLAPDRVGGLIEALLTEAAEDLPSAGPVPVATASPASAPAPSTPPREKGQQTQSAGDLDEDGQPIRWTPLAA